MGKIKTRHYAKRLTSPYKGVIQVVENKKVRALSLNGIHWELQFMHEAPKSFWGGRSSLQGNLEVIRAFARIARWDAEQGLRRLPLDPRINANTITEYCEPVLHRLEQQTPPFTLQDHYEYWLLDENDKRPLALLASCCREKEIDNKSKQRPLWCAMNANELALKNTDEEQRKGLPPMTYRIEQLVKKRAGQNPVARWFLRDATGKGRLVNKANKHNTNKTHTLENDVFPATLLREDWVQTTDQQLIQRYVSRMTPRLLVLQNLSHTIRDQLEERARAYAVEVAHFYSLYPTIANHERMTTIRVEARLREAF